jgi:hypothetical protein
MRLTSPQRWMVLNNMLEDQNDGAPNKARLVSMNYARSVPISAVWENSLHVIENRLLISN